MEARKCVRSILIDKLVTRSAPNKVLRFYPTESFDGIITGWRRLHSTKSEPESRPHLGGRTDLFPRLENVVQRAVGMLLDSSIQREQGPSGATLVGMADPRLEPPSRMLRPVKQNSVRKRTPPKQEVVHLGGMVCFGGKKTLFFFHRNLNSVELVLGIVFLISNHCIALIAARGVFRVFA